MANIEINYQDTINKAQQLKALASDVKSLANSDITGINHQCQVVWKGDASKTYQKKLNQMEERLKKRSNNLKNTADAIEKSARRMKYLDEMARSLFS